MFELKINKESVSSTFAAWPGIEGKRVRIIQAYIYLNFRTYIEALESGCS